MINANMANRKISSTVLVKDYVEMVPAKTMCSILLYFCKAHLSLPVFKSTDLYKFQMQFSRDDMDFHIIALSDCQLHETTIVTLVLMLVVVAKLHFLR